MALESVLEMLPKYSCIFLLANEMQNNTNLVHHLRESRLPVQLIAADST